MTFLAPIFFYLGLGMAVAAVGLHLIVTRQPLSSLLPTVRFVPPSAVRVTTVVPVPEDRLLLALRVLLALVIGTAFARPVIVPRRRALGRVVLADVSRAVGNIGSTRDSVRALLAPGDVLVLFDSAARVIGRGTADSAARLARSERVGRLSPALITAFREAAKLRASADSIDVAIVSPLRAAEIDGATQALRTLWPGRLHLVRIAAAADSAVRSPAIALRAAVEDPIALALAAGGVPQSDSGVRVVRDAATAADSAWAAAGRRTLVRWPVSGAPPGWVARAPPDTVGAVVAGEAPLVYPLERRWRLDPAAPPARVAARWVDGEPAAVERRVGLGCVRDVAAVMPTDGDVMLRTGFGHLVRALAAPCAMIGEGPAAGESDLAALAGSGPLAPTRAIRAPETITTPLVPWLLGLALALALLELLVRGSGAPVWREGVEGERAGSDEAAA